MIFRQIVKSWQWGVGKAVAATVAAHINSVSVGLSQGYSAVVLPQLKNTTTLGIPITDVETSWIASLGVISNPVGALLAGILMEIVGRKTTIQFTTLPYLIGWILIAFSDDIVKLYCGRFITGLAVGMATASYVYVAEISPAEHRGVLSASGPVHVSLGVLLVYVLGSVCHWQYVAACCTLASIFSYIVMHWMPESPAWLMARGRHREASEALMWLRSNPNLVEAELKELEQTKASSADSQTQGQQQSTLCYFVHRAQSHCKMILNGHIWKPFIILVLLFVFQEGCGIYVILYYAVNFFQEVGTSFNEYAATIAVAVVRFIMSIVGAFLIKSFGRKTLTVFSGLGMALAMCVCSIYEHFYYHLPPEERPVVWVPLVCVLMHVCLSMVGFLQIPWIMTGELFPMSVRGIMGGLVSSIAHLLIFTSVKTYPSLLSTLGLDGTLCVFSVTGLCGAIYCFTVLPETKGKSLKEIEFGFNDAPSTQQDSCSRNPTGTNIYSIKCLHQREVKSDQQTKEPSRASESVFASV